MPESEYSFMHFTIVFFFFLQTNIMKNYQKTPRTSGIAKGDKKTFKLQLGAEIA